jgi:hypothetical protein
VLLTRHRPRAPRSRHLLTSLSATAYAASRTRPACPVRRQAAPRVECSATSAPERSCRPATRPGCPAARRDIPVDRLPGGVGSQQPDQTDTATGDTRPAAAEQQRWLSPSVAGVGAASFFSDTGHEMTTAVLPAFLSSVLHTGPAALGGIEAVSDALMGVAKLAGGPIADHPGWRARAAPGGYLGTAALGGPIGLTVAVWQVIALRAGSWIARGLRSPSRDALLAAIAPTAARGRAFGLERAGDNLGAVAGPLLAAALLAVIGVRGTLLVAAVPGLFAAVAISITARHARTALSAGGRRRLTINFRRLRGYGLTRTYLPAALFEAGNVATTLLILRATGLLSGGRSATAAASLAILIYAGHNVLAAVASLAGGVVVDRGRPRLVLGAAALVYVGAYAVFAVGSHHWVVLLAGFCLAGIGIGFAETAQIRHDRRSAARRSARLRIRAARPGPGRRRPGLHPGRQPAVDRLVGHPRVRLRRGLDDRLHHRCPAHPPARRCHACSACSACSEVSTATLTAPTGRSSANLVSRVKAQRWWGPPPPAPNAGATAPTPTVPASDDWWG